MTATSSASCSSTPRRLGLIDVALIPPAGARPDYGEPVGHGRPGVLQPLRRPDVLPHQRPRRVLPRADVGLRAGAGRGEAGASSAAEPGNRRHRRRARAGRSARPRRLRDATSRTSSGGSTRQAARRDRGGPRGDRDPGVPGGAERCAAPRYGRALARGCRGSKRENPGPRPRSPHRMRRSRARRAHRQRHADAQALHARRGTPPRSAGVPRRRRSGAPCASSVTSLATGEATAAREAGAQASPGRSRLRSRAEA